VTCCPALALVIALPPVAVRPGARATAAEDLRRLQGEWELVALPAARDSRGPIP
jgi:hypothetical protein